ncbi:hypothetical protein OHB00_24995 [Streptomyces sp. NBC_00631]|uniref:hypothetical protein n=1 Tax=Streptomyces sp. NBC_00631 TaxID=2975793 RepID=UPI0030E0C725
MLLRSTASGAPAAGPTPRRRASGGRWGTVTAASAVAACLASALTACGGGGADGYTAVGAAGGTPVTSARPTGSVTLVPLDGATGTRGGTVAGPGTTADEPAGAASASGGSPGGTNTAVDTATSPQSPSSPSSSRGDGARPPVSGPAVPNSPQPGASSAPPAPAALTWSTPTREATDQRWCEKATVTFVNSGGTAVRSGTVTLGTHIIDLLGIDWSTVTSTEPLPAPIAPGSRTSRTWTVCVDDWRVPLGMHIETRVAAVDWS